MKTFSDLRFKPLHDGVQALEFFPNGYGVSVVRHEFSYGYKEGLYEVAVIKGTESNWDLTYDTPITDDVIGYCTPEKVTEIMKQVQEL